MGDVVERLNAALRDRYRIDREIGEGGMATVYLADDLRHERRVALKVLRPALAAIVGAHRFLAEIKTTANLQHPHILPLFDSGEADGFLFYVMPYVEGESLRERLDREHQLPVDDAVRVAKDVAEALDYAHGQGVVHRDIKPANILIQAGRPVISDFGIALAVSTGGADRLTETGLSVGTPHYMSPEQATGDQAVGPATDTYALGCVLYELLVGEPPYTGSTPQAILGKIIAGELAWASQQRASVPANVDAAIRKALEKLPADRFARAEDFARALEDPGFRHGYAVASVMPAGPWRSVSMAVSGLALALAAALAWALLRPPPLQPVSRFQLSLPVGLEVNAGNGVGVTVSPDGYQIVFDGLSGGETQLWRRPLDQLVPTAIPGTQNARNPRFSADGAAVAFTRNSTLATVSLTGGPPLTLVPDSVPDAQGGLDWGPDGNLYFRKEGLGIWRVSASGGTAEAVTTLEPGESGHTWLDVLPNGAGILFSRRGPGPGGVGPGTIAVVSLGTGAVSTLFEGAMARYVPTGHVVYTSAEGALLAVPFDQDALVVTGPARTLLEGVQVRAGAASDFALSDTGVLVYRPGSALSATPVWVGRDGSEEALDEALGGDLHDPAISPDGGKVALAYSSGGGPHDIWIYEVEEGAFTRLTLQGNNLRPFWSPDGSDVGFLSTRDGQQSAYARAADLSDDARLLRNGSDAPVADAVWTPDGRWLVFEKDEDLFYAAPHPDSTAVALLDGPFLESAPSLSPDGRWLAYHSDESGQFQVYARPFPGPGGRAAVSIAGGRSPFWAATGEIVYLDADNFWVVAAVSTEPEFAVESRTVFGSAARYQTDPQGGRDQFNTSPDARRLAAIRQASLETHVVVLNFFEELRTLTWN